MLAIKECIWIAYVVHKLFGQIVLE